MMTSLRPTLRAGALAVLCGIAVGCQSTGGAADPASAYDRWRDEARLLEAERYLEAGDTASAVRELEAWNGADGTARGYLMRADLALRLGDEAGAAEVLEEGLAAFPDDPGLVALGARSAVDRADWERAVELHRTWATLAPNDPVPVSGLIRSLVASGRTAEAARLGGRALERFPTDRRLATLVGDAWFVAGDPRRALRAWERAEAAGWTGSGLDQRRLLALMELGDAEGAVLVAQTLGVDRLAPALLAPVGALALEVGKVGFARESLRRHCGLAPQDGAAWLDLARAEFLAGDRGSAVSMARRARREGADPAAASLLEARALALLGRMEAAGDAYAAALGAGASEEALRPELERLQELLGNVAYANGSASARPREAAFHDG